LSSSGPVACFDWCDSNRVSLASQVALFIAAVSTAPDSPPPGLLL